MRGLLLFRADFARFANCTRGCIEDGWRWIGRVQTLGMRRWTPRKEGLFKEESWVNDDGEEGGEQRQGRLRR